MINPVSTPPSHDPQSDSTPIVGKSPAPSATSDGSRQLLRRRVPVLLSSILALLLLTGAGKVADDFAAIGRGIDLFGTIYRELSLNYVDALDADRLVRAGIRGMLAAVDPFTTFIEKEERADVDMLATGSYGGIGITVSERSGRHVVSGVLDTTVLTAYDLRIGDEIVRIDTTVVDGKAMDLKGLLRGRQGTTVLLTVRRPPRTETHSITITRRDVSVRSLALATRLDGGIGYIKLDRFTRSAGEDVRDAYRTMSSDSSLRAVILDLRDNPGGLLDAAVDVCEKFLPAGAIVVSTRGRQERYTRTYVSEEQPIEPRMPLIVLVNGASASASEIVAGAVQDHDRGIIIGTATFGKGLVQTIVPVGPEASLKLTSSKYYTPSGRCIQKPIVPKDEKAHVIIKTEADTARWFRTLQYRRPVFASGGIIPDTVVTADTISHFVVQLVRNGILFDFATRHANTHALHAAPVVDDRMKRALRTHMDTISFDAQAEVSAAYVSLRAAVRAQGYDRRTQDKLSALELTLKKAHSQTVDANWQEIRRQLEMEFAQRFGGRSARLRASLPSDKQLRSALMILNRAGGVAEILRSSH